ncbi:YkgJ family cysteine cluster protein [Methanolobus sp.]|jgi:Fe-S-cluster containining protein|uniref:YkgJ family cysteine cluster protein n=1 Tax=Methanolobus sp. TaxID=1874737 RepID=UPI0025E9394A|nr:YkgJ family cysteine cluster protein [Methanolobus sp.]
MHEKRTLSDLTFFKIVQEILSHYSWPRTCPAICCKIADINLDENDLNTLGEIPKDKIESFIEDGERHYKMSPPCPFLESDKCTVYDRRPTMCRLFPFNITTMPDALLLFPCDMGGSIFEDYVEYSNNILKRPVPTETTGAFKQSHSSFDIKLNEDLPIPMLL